MIIIVNNNRFGVTEYSISELADLEKIDKDLISPTSTVSLINSQGLRVFILSNDKEWIEL